MMPAALVEPTLEPVESLLRDELARGDAMLAAAGPVLRYLLVPEGRMLLSDEVVARVRGMLADVAGQLLAAQAEAGRVADPVSFVDEREARLAERLADEPALLAHVHGLAVEGRLTLQLQARSNVDPVLCPLLQELTASSDDALAGSAMAVLAAQARFLQHYRRMALPLGELPGELLHVALLALRAEAGGQDSAAATAERHLRDAFDESCGRLGLISRLVMQADKSALHALDVRHAGLAIFASALATASGQDRDGTVLSFSDVQFVRLALTMRAAGFGPQQIERQSLYLLPETVLPEGLGRLSAERAAMLLTASAWRSS